MQRRDFLGFSIAAGLSMAGLAGCSKSGPLAFGIHPWIGYEPLYLAEEFGWMPESVVLRSGSSSSDSMDGLLSGELGGAALTLDETIRVWSQGTELVVVAVTVDLPVNQHPAAWSRGEIDASVGYEPPVSALEREGGFRLFDSSEMPETIFDVLVVTRDTADRNPGAVRDLVAAHFAGLRHLVRSMHDAIYRVANRQGVLPENVKSALGTVMLPDLAANQRYLAASGRVESMARSLSRLMVNEGLISSTPDFQHLCDSAFLPRRNT